MRRLARALAALTALATGCTPGSQPALTEDEQHQLRAAIERDVRDVVVTGITLGDRLESSSSFRVDLQSDTTDPAAARRSTRAVAGVVARQQFGKRLVATVQHEVDGQPPWHDFIEFDAGSGASDTPLSVRRACPSGPDLTALAPAFGWDAMVGPGPELAHTATVRADLSQDELRRNADGAARFVWGCYPAPLSSLNLTINVPDATDQPAFTYTAADLRQRFGPRPAGLPS
jgi:hypothetical protein